MVAPLVTLTVKQREEMERRKQFWTRGRSTTAIVQPTTSSGNNWESVQFTKNSGGTATASKFLRLMGAKDVEPISESADGNVDDNDEIVRRNQMFSTMERQFETARAVTHKKKGQGFGCGAPKSTKKYF